MAPRNRLDAGEGPYARPAIGSGRVYRSLSRCEERALCLRTSLRVHRLGEPDFHRMAADERLSADRHQWIDGGASPRARSFRLETSLRESAIHTAPSVEVYSPSVSCLDRKRARAERFLSPLGISSGSRTGRPRAGWLYN